MPLRDVVADRDQPLGDDAGERRADDRVGERLARERDARARRLQRLILLRGAVLRRLVLLARRFDLRPALVELRLRDDALVEQRLDAGELALREVERRPSRSALRAPRSTSNAAPPVDAEPRLDLRGVGFGFLELRVGLGRREADRARRPATTGVPRSIGVATTRPAVSAATSACSSAVSVPVARMKRAIGCSTAATGATRDDGAAPAVCSLALASPALQAP